MSVVDLLRRKPHCDSGYSFYAGVRMRDNTTLTKSYPVSFKREIHSVVVAISFHTFVLTDCNMLSYCL